MTRVRVLRLREYRLSDKNTLSKILEKVIADYIVDIVEEYTLLL